MSTATPVTFETWLRRKRAAYAVLLSGVGLGMIIPAALLMRARLGVPEIGDSAWLAAAPFGWLHATFGLPVTAQLVVVPLVLWVAVACGVIAFERLLYHFDRDGQAWSSLVWTFRSWPMAVAWTVAWIVAYVGAGYVAWMPLVVVVACVMPLLLWSFAWNASNLERARAPWLWRPRLPTRRGALVAAITVVAIVGAGLAWEFASREAPAAAWALLPLVAWITLAGSALAAREWISRGSASLRHSLRLAAGPASAAMLLMAVRGLALLVLVALWLVPAWCAFNVMAPGFEPTLRTYGAELPDAWMDDVRMSRSVVAWWWAIALLLTNLAYLALQWFAVAATGRLLVEKGWIPTPPTRPDSGPPSTARPTA
jgi:hypothetical protein